MFLNSLNLGAVLGQSLVTPDFGLIFWQTVTFLIVLFFLSKFAWKPIVGALKEREDSIENALNEAKSAKDEMAKLKADNQDLLKAARAERDEMIRDAKAVSDKMIEEARQKADEEIEKRMEIAETNIKNAEKAALENVKNEVANISLQIAEKLMRKQLDNEAAQKDLANSYLKDLNLN